MRAVSSSMTSVAVNTTWVVVSPARAKRVLLVKVAASTRRAPARMNVAKRISTRVKPCWRLGRMGSPRWCGYRPRWWAGSGASRYSTLGAGVRDRPRKRRMGTRLGAVGLVGNPRETRMVFAVDGCSGRSSGLVGGVGSGARTFRACRHGPKGKARDQRRDSGARACHHTLLMGVADPLFARAGLTRGAGTGLL